MPKVASPQRVKAMGIPRQRSTTMAARMMSARRPLSIDSLHSGRGRYQFAQCPHSSSEALEQQENRADGDKHHRGEKRKLQDGHGTLVMDPGLITDYSPLPEHGGREAEHD